MNLPDKSLRKTKGRISEKAQPPESYKSLLGGKKKKEKKRKPLNPKDEMECSLDTSKELETNHISPQLLAKPYTSLSSNSKHTAVF